MDKVLVTGGFGYVGSLLLPQLLERGNKVTVLDDFTFENCYNALLMPVHKVPLIRHPNLEKVVKGDIRDSVKVKEAVKGADTVIHLAAIVGAPACDKNPELAKSVNVQGTSNIVSQLSGSQRLLFASTGSIYGKIDAACKEETPLNPQSIYGATKAEAEKIALEHGGIAFRFATAFGLSPRLRMDLLVNDFAYKMTKDRHLDVYEAEARRTFIHSTDIAGSFLFGMDNFEQMKGEPFNLGDDSMNYTKQQIAEMIKERVEERFETKVNLWTLEGDKRFDPDTRDYEVSYGKIKAVGGGFKAKTAMGQGIEELIEFYSVFTLKNPFSNV